VVLFNISLVQVFQCVKNSARHGLEGERNVGGFGLLGGGERVGVCWSGVARHGCKAPVRPLEKKKKSPV
jgi:hypothetical protein